MSKSISEAVAEAKTTTTIGIVNQSLGGGGQQQNDLDTTNNCVCILDGSFSIEFSHPDQRICEL